MKAIEWWRKATPIAKMKLKNYYFPWYSMGWELSNREITHIYNKERELIKLALTK